MAVQRISFHLGRLQVISSIPSEVMRLSAIHHSIPALYNDRCYMCLKVKWSVYLTYGRALGLTMTLLIFGACTLFQTTSVISSLWLTKLTADPVLQNASAANTSHLLHLRNLYLGVYGGLGAVQGRAFKLITTHGVCKAVSR